jgi:hypothetical protein
VTSRLPAGVPSGVCLYDPTNSTDPQGDDMNRRSLIHAIWAVKGTPKELPN